MIDYGYAQSELCWGTAAQMTEPIIRQICQGIQAIGGSRVRMGVQVGTWDDLDMAVNLATEYGLKPLLCIISNAQFGYDGTPAGFAAQCKAIATRYGPAGTGQVSEYELFNEENDSLNAPAVGNAAAFVPFLKAGYTAIKSVHTSSTVLCGGCIPAPDTFIPFIGVATNPIDWYKGIYAAGGKGYFDAAAEHLYWDGSPSPSTSDVQWSYIPGIRAVMDANGDTDKKIWITEMGVPNTSADVKTLVQQRDRLKAAVDVLIANTDALKLGIWFIYNYRCYAGGDVVGGTFGMVYSDFTPVEPVYDYAATIKGAPSNPIDIVPPSPPTSFTVTTTGPQTATASWGPAMDDVGVTVYRIKNAADNSILATTALLGQTSTDISGLTPGTPYVAYATAVDAAGNESNPSNTFPFTTASPVGIQANFSYNFTGTGSTLPTVFVQLGLGFAVSSDVALPNAPTVDGEYWTIAPYGTDQQSPDHSSQIMQSTASANPDRAALSLVRIKPDGSQFAGAMITGGGTADACKIVTYAAGVLTIRAAEDAAPLQPGERLVCTAEGNVYTALRIAPDNTSTVVLSWTDTKGAYAGAVNRRAGIGWWHRMVGGIVYPPPGITGLWKASDLYAVAPSVANNASSFDPWMLGITKQSDLGLVVSTGLWEAAL